MLNAHRCRGKTKSKLIFSNCRSRKYFFKSVLIHCLDLFSIPVVSFLSNDKLSDVGVCAMRTLVLGVFFNLQFTLLFSSGHGGEGECVQVEKEKDEKEMSLPPYEQKISPIVLCFLESRQ